MSEATRDLAGWRAAARGFDGPHGRIAWWSAGEGPPLLLIHGFPTSSWDFSRLWDRLAASHRLVAVDMLGFGLSDKPARHRYSLFEQADLQERLCARLGIETADVLAHDYGDTVAQELLARQAEGSAGLRIGAVTFLNGGLIPGEHRPRPIQRVLAGPFGGLVARRLDRRRFGRSFSRVFAPGRRPSTGELDDFWALIAHGEGHRIAHRLIRYMRERVQNRDRWVGALRSNLVPQRFVCGALDPVSGARMARAYRRVVPDPDVVLLPNVGHYPQWEAPEAVLGELARSRRRPPTPARPSG